MIDAPRQNKNFFDFIIVQICYQSNNIHLFRNILILVYYWAEGGGANHQFIVRFIRHYCGTSSWGKSLKGVGSLKRDEMRRGLKGTQWGGGVRSWNDHLSANISSLLFVKGLIMICIGSQMSGWTRQSGARSLQYVNNTLD